MRTLIRTALTVLAVVAVYSVWVFTASQNYLPKYNGSGGLVDSGIFEAANGDIGIGTNIPGAHVQVVRPDATLALSDTTSGGGWPQLRLESNGQIGYIVNAQAATDGRADALVIQSDTATGLWLGTNAATPIMFSPGGIAPASEKVRITASGNVGIGTTTPSAKLHVAGDVTVDGNIGAKYQDVAEWVPASTDIPAGTVVVTDPDHANRVRTSTQAYDTAVAGVVSAQPGIILGEKAAGRIAVAQSGRVRVKVDATYGAVTPGDLLVTSPTPGFAMRSEPIAVGGMHLHRPGTILGKALERFAGGKGEVLILLTLQ